jgi:hypothetical protein
VFTNRYYNKYLEDDLCCMEKRWPYLPAEGKSFVSKESVFDSEKREPAL